MVSFYIKEVFILEKTYVVYLHRNKINNKCYVGQTCQKPEARWGLNGNGYKDQIYFYRAIQKYGWNNFEHIILETNIPQDKINERECYWTGYYHALAPEGYTLQAGKKDYKVCSVTSSLNRSQSSLKKWENEEYREKVSNGRKEMWKNASPECKEKMLANLNRSGTKGKQVQCVETNTIYSSTREAERLTGINHCNISQVCIGKRKTAGKFHWRYIEE